MGWASPCEQEGYRQEIERLKEERDFWKYKAKETLQATWISENKVNELMEIAEQDMLEELGD